MSDRRYDLEERLLEYAALIVRLVETDELVRIFAASIRTARANAGEGAMCREEPGAYSELPTLNAQRPTLNPLESRAEVE